MTRYARLPLIVVLLSVLSTAQQSSTPADEVTPPSGEKKLCKFEGRAVNALTGEPVRKAKVSLYRRAPDARPLSATSDADGGFLFENVEPGTYQLSGEKTGYVNEMYGLGASPDSRTPLTLAPGQHMKDVQFKLTPQGVITGKVLDDEGEPAAARAPVQVMRRGRAGRPMMVAGESTNDLGEFRIANLAPGRYFLSVQTWAADDAGARPKKDEPEEAFVQTFYPGVTDFASAVAVEVKAGQEVSGVHITLRKGRVYRVAGSIAGLTAAQSARAMSVLLQPRERKEWMWGGRVGGRVKEDGTFEIAHAQPGAYYLSVFNRGDGWPRVVGRTPVDVSDSNVKGVVVPLFEPLQISGTVRVEGNEKVSLDGGRVFLQATEGMAFGARPAMVSPDGTFKMDAVSPDKYYLNAVGFPETTYLKSARFGNQDALDSGLDLTEAQGAVTLELTLGTKPGKVEGTVQQDTKPVPGSFITMAPDPMRPGQRYLLKYASADQNGRFSINGVAPGNYTLYAWRENPELDLRSEPDALKGLESKAAKVTVQEGGAARADLTPLKPEDMAANERE